MISYFSRGKVAFLFRNGRQNRKRRSRSEMWNHMTARWKNDEWPRRTRRGWYIFSLTSPWNSLAHARAAWAIDANILKFALPDALLEKRFTRSKYLSTLISLAVGMLIYLTPLPAQELETISHKRGWWYIKSTQKNYAVCSQEERSFQTLILSYKGVWNFGNKDKFFLCLEIVNVKAKYYFFL